MAENSQILPVTRQAMVRPIVCSLVELRKVPRAIRLKFLDVRGQPQEIQAAGVAARVIQHEVDHLDGVLMIDRLPGLH